MDKRTISRLRRFAPIIRDRRLGNYAVFERIVETAEKSRSSSHEANVVQKDLDMLNTLPATRLDFRFSSRVGESSPGFVVHNIRSKATIKNSLSLVLDWIADNGLWI